jgi:hypothetical protein
LYFKFYKYFLIGLMAFFACNDIDRDNILDPKNPASERPQIITVEAFVNTSDSLINNQYNSFLLEALDQLENIYSEKITIAEYHRSIFPQYPDTLSTIANEILYGYYFDYFWNLNNNTVKGVPDVYINGTEARIQGASSTATVLFRLQEVLDPMISQNGYFTIEPNITKDGNEYKISAKIARLGSTNAEDIILKAVIISKFDNGLHERVVTEYLKSQDISSISNGEIKNVDLGEVPDPPVSTKVIIMVTSEDELQVFQSLEVDLN